MKQYLGLALLLAACGGGSKSSKDTTPPAATATCQDLGDRATSQAAAADMEGIPADFGTRIGAMIARVCADDQWSVEVRACAMASDDFKGECRPKLDATQEAHLYAEEEAFGRELMEAMAGTDDLLVETGMPACDALRSDVAFLAGCTQAQAAMGDALVQMVADARLLSAVAEEDRDATNAQCDVDSEELGFLLMEHQCLGG